MTSDAAREALRARQGAGARYDSEHAPHDDLLLARRGTAYFARKLNELHDDELSDPSLRPGWSRRHLIAHVSYQARTMAEALASLHTRQTDNSSEWAVDLALAATLPARALRHLFEHSAKHLDVEWRDLPDASWATHLALAENGIIPANQTARLRAVEIWHAAIDLGNGARASDLPEALRA